MHCALLVTPTGQTGSSCPCCPHPHYRLLRFPLQIRSIPIRLTSDFARAAAQLYQNQPRDTYLPDNNDSDEAEASHVDA